MRTQTDADKPYRHAEGEGTRHKDWMSSFRSSPRTEKANYRIRGQRAPDMEDIDWKRAGGGPLRLLETFSIVI